MSGLEQAYGLVVICGGPAGMAAAVAAAENGVARVLLLERGEQLGGVLPQCIHDGFGLIAEGRSMTGPEYARLWRAKAAAAGVEVLTGTMALSIEIRTRFTVTLSGPHTGYGRVTARSLVLATGCRERALGSMLIPGSRPAGILTAGAAQYMMNIQNYRPVRTAVILGFGDIGLIMARRLTLEGMRVKLVLGEKGSGLMRNYIQCIKEFSLPVAFGYTVVSTHGYGRLRGVTVAPVDDLSRRRYIPCDTLIVAAGLIPEAELFTRTGRSLDGQGGIPVDAGMQSAVPGLFACGNVVRIYDTVDEVSAVGTQAGRAAASYVTGRTMPAADEQTRAYSAGRKMDMEAVRAVEGGATFCLACPRGCIIAEQDGVFSGGACEKGADYARAETSGRLRTVTTTVRAAETTGALLPVRTDRPVPIAQVGQVMAACRRTRWRAPVSCGAVLLADVAGTGANVVAADDSWRGGNR
ncbi:MAG: FAD-dependent oxidoreductase [Oscillospiraceae bacterium]|nr:FAD-dependent oxidoreductase [Oscillospiraceae bacterium]